MLITDQAPYDCLEQNSYEKSHNVEEAESIGAASRTDDSYNAALFRANFFVAFVFVFIDTCFHSVTTID